MKIKSVFSEGEKIPERYTCDGKNVNLPLKFSDVPENAKSLVLIVDDPDSPSKLWNHWVLWNIPPYIKGIKENSVPSGALQGLNDFGNIGYGGPCPHSGAHRYRFQIYALDKIPELKEGSEREELEKEMEGHVIEKDVLTGVYEKEK